MSFGASEPVLLKRDCEGTQIPAGNKTTLPAGSQVRVTQTLGGQVTVMTDYGYLFRIEAKDADALGEEYAALAKESMPAAAAPDAPYDEAKVWEQLKTVFDPEIPVNIVDLGLVYRCEAKPMPEGGQRLEIQMTMTAPGCGMGDVLKEDVKKKVLTVPGVRQAQVDVVWDPPWDQTRMSEIARLQLGWM